MSPTGTPAMPQENDPSSSEMIEARRENTALWERVRALETERDELARQNGELFILQQVFSAINSTLDIDDILSMVLRGIREALRFERVILFDVLADGKIVQRLETDTSGLIVAAPNPRLISGDTPLHEVAQGRIEFFIGSAGHDQSPLEDPRGTFCMVPLVTREAIRGVIYADDMQSVELGDSQLRTLMDFASQAAIAVENARLYEETKRLALTDHMTGIANARALNEQLERELINAERYNYTFVFVLLDLDDLKKINDTNGHAAGDRALKKFAEVLRHAARKGDIVARYAGDEFVVVMSQTDKPWAEAALDRVLKALLAERLQCSIGAAIFPYDGRDAKALFFAADEALYRAKQAGKGRFLFSERPASPSSARG